MYVRDMVFEMHDVIEDQPLRLAHWMVAVYLLAWWYLLQISTFNVIHHV
jgi:cytochrome b